MRVVLDFSLRPITDTKKGRRRTGPLQIDSAAYLELRGSRGGEQVASRGGRILCYRLSNLRDGNRKVAVLEMALAASRMSISI
jgi:hypothetical protein